MLDIKFIRENIEAVKDSCKKRKVDCDIEKLLKVDEKRRKLITELESILAEKNKANKKIASLNDKERKKLIKEMKEVDKKGDKIRCNLQKTEKEFDDLMLSIPNILMSDVPDGKDETENKVIKKVGELPKFDFVPKDHVQLGEDLDIIEIKKAAKISGARFNYLKGKLALLEFALVRYTFDILTDKNIIGEIAKLKGVAENVFVPVIPPVMIRPDVYTKMARLSEEDKEDKYYFKKDDVYLIGSAEHTLGPLHMDEIILEKDLPIRYAGFSTAFRREAGSYGKDTRGILRVHQFDKIEMETFTTGENGVKEQDFIVALQEYLVGSLKIPYQVVKICTGDMGKPDARQIDIECWLPGQNKYRETHTSDYMADYQARRLNTKVKRKEKTEFVYMNDATAFAVGRILIAILENYQQKDGSVKVPLVLQKYLPFEKIENERK